MAESLRQSLWALLLLLDLRFGSFWARLRMIRLRQILRALLMLAFALIVFLIIYRIELFILSYLMGVPELGRLVIARFFEVAFLLLFLTLIVSSAFTALAVLYRDEELRFLFSLPIPEGVIFTVKFVEVLIYSSWTLIMFAAPFLMAYAAFTKVHWLTFWALFYGLMLPLILISGCVGVAGALFVRWLQDLIPRKRLLGGLIGAVVIACIAIFFLIFFSAHPTRRGFIFLFSQLESGVSSSGSFAPHQLISQGFFSILESRYGELFRIIYTLLGLCALIVLLTLDMGKVLYYRSWQSGRVVRPPNFRRLPERTVPDRLLASLEPAYAALFRKDFLGLLRHPVQWSQIILFLAFWALYLASFLNLNRFFDLQASFWQMLLFYLNFAFATFFAAVMNARLVFPLVSLEGRAFAMLRSTSLAMENLLWTKLWGAFFPVLFMTGSMIIVGNAVLRVPPGLFMASIIAIFLSSLTMTAMSLSLGAAFSRFGDRHPAQIANTPGGAYCLFLCLTTATLICVIFAWPVYLYYKFTGFYVIFPLTEWISSTILIIALGILLTIFPMKIGQRALYRDLIV